ncbi:HipA family kinase [Polyangium spumosum]|uniref:Aminotransferase class I and II n=1 Tax=Polyangium spumosum TaxID=889282 RepID=A0A6N7PED7_9BACT|nr:HipA family kinase [Polyangium spumosum]MRG90388.1 aminotransferase class I and II [Polyangium spumosum]
MLRTVNAVRYVTPLREGGSVPALVEADDDGLYVVKLRGAAQGAKALIAELVAGELARAAGLAVPEIVLIHLDPELGRAEPHREISDLLDASAGLNLALDYLPGSVTFDPVAGPLPDPALASRVVLFDSFVTNVDRTPKNPNLLTWHHAIWLIDHGASLYFHHGWGPDAPLAESDDPFAFVRKHVLLPFATALSEAAAHLQAAWSEALVRRVAGAIPDAFLTDDMGFPSPDAHRAAYGAWLSARLAALPSILAEAERAQAEL